MRTPGEYRLVPRSPVRELRVQVTDWRKYYGLSNPYAPPCAAARLKTPGGFKMMMVRALGGIAVVCSLWTLGCSGSGSGGSGSGGSDAATQCNQVGESVCQANANCAVETTEITEA